ncbi:hypothetical protein ONA70_19995 [Micromonospora yasonensis]|uniref:hypothetical protein n=1 Tax=Micromonospora yasonensis TaxID=1128667 RepID=UPI00222EEA53|nr:hypothetical protein [Micromonospora yasonensis]MCW3842385.1 hypothetical protein [Micromonospora yasonensis]
MEPVAGARGRPRRAAVYGGWLARGHLQLGDVEAACAVATTALLDAVRSGSSRAVGQLTEVRHRLAAHGDEPAARRYADLLAGARPWLPLRPPRVTGAPRSRWPREAPRPPRRHAGMSGPEGTG